MVAHLWTPASVGPPMEYVELILCRYIYHAPPQVVRAIPMQTVVNHLICIDQESKMPKS